MQKFNLELTIDEIVLIKECLFHFTDWKADTADRYSNRMHSFDFLTQKQIESLRALSDKLSPYGYGM